MSAILRPKAQCLLLGISRATLHRIEKADSTFPKKVRLGINSVGRVDSELLAWIDSRKGGSHA